MFKISLLPTTYSISDEIWSLVERLFIELQDNQFSNHASFCIADLAVQLQPFLNGGSANALLLVKYYDKNIFIWPIDQNEAFSKGQNPFISIEYEN